MRRIFIIGIVLISCNYLRAQFIYLDSVYRLYNYNEDFTYSSLKLSDDKFILTGYYYANSNGSNSTLHSFCINLHGDTLWSKEYDMDTLRSPAMRGAAFDNQKNIIIGGGAFNATAQGEQGILVKTDSMGNLIWIKNYSLPSYSYYTGLYGQFPIITNDNHYLLVCGNGIGADTTDFLIIETDTAGNELTRWEYYNERSYDLPICGLQTKDSDFVFAGYSGKFDSIFHMLPSIYVIKSDRQGNKLWEIGIKSLYSDPHLLGDASVNAILETDDGFILAGTRAFRSNLNYNTIYGPRGWEKCWIGKIDKHDGHLIWEHYYGIDTADVSEFYGLATTNDGGYVLCGIWNFAQNTEGRAWVVKTDSIGNELWSTVITHPLDSIHYTDQMELHNVYQIEGGYLVSGFRWPDWPVNQNPFAYVITIDNSGCWELGCSVTGVQEVPLASNANLIIYPNPNNGQMRLKYSMETSSNETSLCINDMLGRQLFKLPLTGTEGEVELNEQKLPAGMYFCALKQSNKLVAVTRFTKQ